MKIWQPCFLCNGSTRIPHPTEWDPIFQLEIQCPACNGNGGKHIEVEETQNKDRIPKSYKIDTGLNKLPDETIPDL